MLAGVLAGVWVLVVTLLLLLASRALHQASSLAALGTSGRHQPPLTLIQPLYGLSNQLESCLRSWSTQVYGAEVQHVLCLQDPEDAAMPIARRIADEFGAQICVHEIRPGWQGKTSNLYSGLACARHQLLVFSDADVWAPPQALGQLVRQLLSSEAAPQLRDDTLVAALVIQRGGKGFWGEFYAYLWNAVPLLFWAAPLQLGLVTGIPGGAFALSKKALAKLGGIQAVRSYLAEDIALGRAARKAGISVKLGSLLSGQVGRLKASDFWQDLLRGSHIILRYPPAGIPTGLTAALLIDLPSWLGLFLLFTASSAGQIFLALLLLSLPWLQKTALISLCQKQWKFCWYAPLMDLLRYIALLQALCYPFVRWGGVRWRVRRGGHIQRMKSS